MFAVCSLLFSIILLFSALDAKKASNNNYAIDESTEIYRRNSLDEAIDEGIEDRSWEKIAVFFFLFVFQQGESLRHYLLLQNLRSGLSGCRLGSRS